MSVPCKSAKAQEAMLSFLSENYRDSAVVLEFPSDHWRHQSPKSPSQHFAYGCSKMKIGFDRPNDYETAVLRWIATKVGKRRSFPDRGITVPVPWLNCDGHGSSPVIPHFLWDGSEGTKRNVVDEIGWQGVDRWWVGRGSLVASGMSVLGYVAKADREDELIRAEIVRLNSLWTPT